MCCCVQFTSAVDGRAGFSPSTQVEADARRRMRSAAPTTAIAALPYDQSTTHSLTRSLTDALADTAVPFSATLCVAAGGIGFWTFAFPQDLVKSIIQTQSSLPLTPAHLTNPASPATSATSASSASFLATARELVAREGIGRLWRGFPVALFRGVPGAAITFTTYTTVMQNINRQGW